MNSKKNSKKKWKIGSNFCYDFVKITGGPPMLLWLRPKRIYPYGKQKIRGPVLISSNHVGYSDPFVVFCVFKLRRIHSLASRELFSTKFAEVFFPLMKCIRVDQENFALSSVHKAVEKLREGKTVVIFPEGTINTTQPHDNPLSFKSGVSLISYQSGAPVLPVYIVKRDKWYHRQKIVIGRPIDVKKELGTFPSLDALNEMSEFLRQEEIKLAKYYNEVILAKKDNKSLQEVTK